MIIIPMRTTLDKIPTTDRVQLVGQLYPYFTKRMHAITKRPDVPKHQRSESISIRPLTLGRKLKTHYRPFSPSPPSLQ